ncbi:tRNA preQ1(34) S-adenosylmethionine ribosyltransferase-isomerase QueA [Aquihabitans sp. McL0605]|uniref:tRNA preQ1(34) S-adenosylmethionine ribosyltransferase-isomerase QueA n=1 Tax=Aquihabitans sp. McL0605 TaxID=3415671 RepID=UPI003CFA9E59
MDTTELDYELPASAIAQAPVEPRDSARLLVAGAPSGAVQHRTVADLPGLLDPGDLLVVNDTRVIPARLHLRKPTGGAVEVLLLERRPEGHWEALVRPSRRVPDGTVLVPDAPVGDDLTVEVGPVLGDDGRRAVTVHGGTDDDLAVLARVGEVPLPPYIHEPLADPDRYQTVYAQRPGSVAAPTAGLHLTDAVLDACRRKGVRVATVDLQVGLGTFRPITADRVEDHPMHAERYRIPDDTLAALDAVTGQVVAVGTTVTRALEAWALTGAATDSTSLFIRDDFRFQVVDRLLTNFHVPRSSLLALVESFVGPRWKDLYRSALDEGYRFLSFGDAMLLDRRDGVS